MCYDYARMLRDINALEKKYDICVFSAGKSVMEKDIPCLRLGGGQKKLLLIGAHHGLEYLTSEFLMKLARNFARSLGAGLSYFGRDIGAMLNKLTLYIIPMLNPDGVDIAVHGLDITNPYHRRLISDVGIHSFTGVWQANAAGVDINHNYDAGWKMVTERPSPSKYGGPCPESESETRAAVKLIRAKDIDMVLAFHSQGREIYYDFDGMTALRSEEIARKMAKASGYALASPTGTASFGGCKDWFIKEFGREGFTVEIGLGKNPLPSEMLDEIYDENARLTLTAMEELIKK